MREVVIFSTDERGLFPNNFMVDCPVVCQHLFLSTPNVCQQKTFDNNREVHFETDSKMFFPNFSSGISFENQDVTRLYLQE